MSIESSARLPIMQERELWRIAQEAMVNVERHAEATTVTVNWQTDGRSGVLEIIDDGGPSVDVLMSGHTWDGETVIEWANTYEVPTSTS